MLGTHLREKEGETRVKVWLQISLLLLLSLLLVLVYNVDPTTQACFPKCMSWQYWGIYCPGCGSSRAVHALAHGRVAEAMRLNPLLVLCVPGLLYCGVRRWLHWFWEWPLPECMASGQLGMILLKVMLVYWVVRNIPMWPFCLLAPR